MSIKHLYEDERPTLLLDFANSKTLDPRITFTRNSIATYVDEQGILRTAAANEARFDHDGTGECRGLLLEQARTNLIVHSEAFNNNTYWGKGAGFNLVGSQPDPAGGTNAFLLEEINGNAGGKNVSTTGPIAWSGSHLTISFYVKSVNRPYVGLGVSGLFQSNVSISLVDGTVGTQESNVIDAAGEYVGGGWWRCWARYNNTSTNVSPQVFIASDDGSITMPTGETGHGLVIYGGQMEESAYVTSYIPTSGSTVQRVSDVFNISGNNFSSWYNPIESTMVVNMSCKNSTGYGMLWGFYGGKRIEGFPGFQTPFEGLAFFLGDNNTQKYLGRAGAGGATWNQDHEIEKCAYSWDFSSGEGTACISGNFAPNPPPATGVPVTTITGGFRLMGGQNASNVLNTGIVSSVAYYNTRLSDATLEALTK